MPRYSKPKPTISDGERDSLSICETSEGRHPAQVSGLFQNDPAFEEFREILRQQREEDYQQRPIFVLDVTGDGGMAERCLST